MIPNLIEKVYMCILPHELFLQCDYFSFHQEVFIPLDSGCICEAILINRIVMLYDFQF